MKKVFTNLINKGQDNNLYLLQGLDDNKPAWYYLRVDKLKLPLLLRECKINKGKIILTDYGEVIARGWGGDPLPPTSTPILKRKKYIK